MFFLERILFLRAHAHAKNCIFSILLKKPKYAFHAEHTEQQQIMSFNKINPKLVKTCSKTYEVSWEIILCCNTAYTRLDPLFFILKFEKVNKCTKNSWRKISDVSLWVEYLDPYTQYNVNFYTVRIHKVKKRCVNYFWCDMDVLQSTTIKLGYRHCLILFWFGCSIRTTT